MDVLNDPENARFPLGMKQLRMRVAIAGFWGKKRGLPPRNAISAAAALYISPDGNFFTF